MATRPNRSQARVFAALVAQYEPRIQRAFMASVTDLQANVNWPELLNQLAAWNVEGAISALNINPAAWAEYSAVVSEAYAASGASTAAQIRSSDIGGVGIRFNMANPRAENWIRENVAQRVTGFTQEQVGTARQVIESGYAQGQNPRTIATDLVGRATGPQGARQGGVLGLDNPRAKRYQAVSQGMRTPEGVRSLVVEHADGSVSLKYKVNKSTAQRILKAYRAGEAVPEAARKISETQYHNALLKDRANTVAETETANAVLSARDDEWHQFAESQGVDPANIIKTWRHRRGASQYHRPDHLAMSGKQVNGLDTPFVFPDGTQMRYAHDPAGGAKHTIKCACEVEYRVNQFAGLT